MVIQGQVVTGRGEGAAFTQLDWARREFVDRLGIDPFPGTLNLIPASPDDLAAWEALHALPGIPLPPPDSRWCSARCFPVRIAGRLPGAIMLPDVPGYPEKQIEVIAALPLRETLGLRDGDRLALEGSRPLPVRGVIFDVDGTLVDSMEAYRAVADLAAAPLGLPISREMVREALNTDSSFWEMAVPPDRPDRDELIRQLHAEAARRWPDALREHGRLVPGLRETLETLRGRGCQLGIVTGSRAAVFQLLQEAGLMGYFSAVVTGKDVQRRKPDPEGLLKCAAALRMPPGQAVYVGDTPLDVLASRAAGMAAVAVLSGAGDSALLTAAGPDWLISSHARLPEIVEAT